jgi:hypothetical protein
LRAVTEEAGFTLRERLTAYPEYLRGQGWMSDTLQAASVKWLDEEYLVSRAKEAA